MPPEYTFTITTTETIVKEYTVKAKNEEAAKDKIIKDRDREHEELDMKFEITEIKRK